ncbi:MAG TPA: GNAT family N-acetyltransferase [Candidatus Butyricicoccus stercorigallinarum]|nr:GNAT family N-acetyltransferase [Candidatus Butyricicoccus stercorigallinarum]
MQLTYQSVTDADIEALAVLATEIWHEFFPGIISVEQVDYMVEQFQSAPALRRQLAEGYRYELVYADGEPIGYIGVHPEEDLLFLSKLYLKKQYRGRGCGRKMIDHVAALARQLDKSGVYLTVNRHNDHTIAVYHATGFETVRTQVADIGNGYVMDDYIMQLSV